ncbi:MAG: two-component system sensor histidine kinase PhoR [Gammaproteobacteria bacterium]|nr:MAG: two-component system sensor histidine kinase PhoR [Gammaproteobacteria bacterium]
MITHNPWPKLLLRFAILLLVAFFSGVFFQKALLFSFIALIIISVWQFYNLFLLEKWLRKSRRIAPPEGSGIWGSMFDQIYKLRRRDKKRSNNLASIIKRFESSALALPDGVISINKNKGMEWWNKHAAKMFGFKWPHDKGQRVDNLIRIPEFTNYYRSGEHGEPINIDSPVNAEIKLEIRIVEYGKKQQLLIARDISELMKLQQIRRDFVANVSHELRTPLTVLHGTAEILSDAREDIPEDLHSSLDLLEQQSARMASLVNDLLTLSRLEAGTNVDDEELLPIKEMIEQLRYEAEILSGDRGHVVRTEVDTELGLKGNQGEITSCFSNLISNAIRYSPDGGEVVIRWYKDGNTACFEVQDSGIGIAPEHVARLTERFYRVDVGRSRSTGGTGLGLAIVKRILIRHNGKLDIKSEVGKGSAFCCCFMQ